MEVKPISVTVRVDYQDALLYLDDVNDRIRDLNLLEETNNISTKQVNTRQALRRVREMLRNAIDPSRAQ